MSPRPPRNGQRSQALIEFALISPVLLLLLFGIIDIGRAIFYYDTLSHAAREGARTAVIAANMQPTNAAVLATVTSQLVGAPVTAPCPQGPITSDSKDRIRLSRRQSSSHTLKSRLLDCFWRKSGISRLSLSLPFRCLQSRFKNSTLSR